MLFGPERKKRKEKEQIKYTEKKNRKRVIN
jgi:hypothetical protein